MGAGAMSAARTRTPKRKIAAKRSRKKQAAAAPPPKQSPVQDLNREESELVLAWFRLLARRRGAWLQHLWTSDGSIDGRATVTHAELAGILANQDAPEAEAEWSRNQQPVRVWEREAEQIERGLNSLPNSRFAKLARVFGLSPEELSLLRLCAAVAFDPALTRVCAYLQDHSGRTYLTEDLASRLLEIGRASVWLPEMNVFRWELIHRREAGIGEPDALLCDRQIRDWLLGKSTLDDELVGFAKLIEFNGAILPEWPVDELASWISESLSDRNPPRLRIVVVAPQGGGKRTFAAAVAAKLNMPLLLLNVDDSEESNWPRLFLHAQRQVFLDNAVLAWTGEAAVRRQWPVSPLLPVQFVLCPPGSEPRPVSGIVDRQVRLPMPEASTRESLWRQLFPAAAKWPAEQRRKLAEHHRVWPGDIVRASHLAADTPADAAVVVRETARSRFGDLAQILECPFRPDDLVLPEGVKQLLDAITFEAEERVRFWQQAEPRRLFPQGRGLVILFSGPPGTGKTMAAQVIAAQLTQDLCRVNVAQLVSKWVGDTSKNVEQVIRVAAESSVVLFFDEADALFAKRSAEIRDAQDKFANTDTAVLLQAIESYPGIAILSTNLKSNIDPAFLRRLRYLVEFQKPDTALQRTLWTKLITALAGAVRAKALESAIQLLSVAGDSTGAQIKFAVLGALFAARAENKPLDARHLLIGLDRELSKEGRGIGTKEREQIMKVGEVA
jgi:ATPase family protein associated with various cellular activities (AAA)/winged helix domain-containing protein